ncbi:hypothetical protein BK007_08335 [Methanobacterium subterraneum]|uniref:N-acetyltransferase domain-containing protein n=1 Tax=Methanobacterium subterraneum TaxID=59277 RepID=A0A2H4VD26_9EURY|nr:bifunctional UDP-2,4-diacetamido-2,4,6-trideoxy-beta-L-altropyranose hydrolase/GNAT family N-acetyltransferase [Methanobacterium subterraneum]AUB56005.1 hypothetical protein BK007_08335 [Methanobacterium subterraneum]
MKIFILTEGSKDIGFGHITRCISIYQAFRKYNFKPLLIVNGDESIVNYYDGIVIFDWFNKSEKLFDKFGNADIIIIDSYMAPKEVYDKLSTITKILVSIDDNNRVEYPKGIIINGSINAAGINYTYNNNSLYLLGSKYVPLRNEFWRDIRKPIRKTIDSVMVTFGGEDNANLTPKILGLLRKFYPEFEKKIVIGKGFSNLEEIKNFVDSNTKLYHNPNAAQMKQLMIESDIAISAGGQTIYELARIGVPCIIINVAENQLNHVKGWKCVGFICYAGWKNDPDLSENILKYLDELDDQHFRMKTSQIGRHFVKGNGSLLIAKKVIRSYVTDNLVLKEADEGYLKPVFNLSNDPEVREQSFSHGEIGFDEHGDWYNNELKNENCFFLVAEIDSEFLGQIRFKINNDSAIISISLVKKYRGIGIGAEILKRSIEILRIKNHKIKRVIAQIKSDNIYSKKFFIKFGFVQVGELNIKGNAAIELEYEMIYHDV